MERRKGRNSAKATRPRQRQGYPVRSCAWCAHPVHGDAVTVTFPDKAQVTFHVACLDQYRAVMWPWRRRRHSRCSPCAPHLLYLSAA